MKKKILFIDRDGTILREPQPDQQIDRLEKFEFLPGAIAALARLAAETDYRFVMVSNQDGLGTPSFPLGDFEPLQQLMVRTLAGEGVTFDEVLVDDSFPHENSPRRKPRTGMVEKYLSETLDRENSYVIGDRQTDMQLAENMGIRGILLGDQSGAAAGSTQGVAGLPREAAGLPEEAPGSTAGVADALEGAVIFNARSWDEIYRFLKNGSRRARVVRKTSETDISVDIDLDGSGGEIATGIGFFDHMLDQIARHGGIGLTVRAVGDLHIDEHHTIEDTAIALGESLRAALGGKKGIGRYGFALPMDESCAEVLLDLGGRTCLVWEAAFDREYVGDFPTAMTRHFFASFCQSAACNLHVRASGDDAHHTIEAIFKAFARCLREAVKQTGGGVPSSKGVL